MDSYTPPSDPSTDADPLRLADGRGALDARRGRGSPRRGLVADGVGAAPRPARSVSARYPAAAARAYLAGGCPETRAVSGHPPPPFPPNTAPRRLFRDFFESPPPPPPRPRRRDSRVPRDATPPRESPVPDRPLRSPSPSSSPSARARATRSRSSTSPKLSALARTSSSNASVARASMDSTFRARASPRENASAASDAASANASDAFDRGGARGGFTLDTPTSAPSAFASVDLPAPGPSSANRRVVSSSRSWYRSCRWRRRVATSRAASAASSTAGPGRAAARASAAAAAASATFEMDPCQNPGCDGAPAAAASRAAIAASCSRWRSSSVAAVSAAAAAASRSTARRFCVRSNARWYPSRSASTRACSAPGVRPASNAPAYALGSGAKSKPGARRGGGPLGPTRGVAGGVEGGARGNRAGMAGNAAGRRRSRASPRARRRVARFLRARLQFNRLLLRRHPTRGFRGDAARADAARRPRLGRRRRPRRRVDGRPRVPRRTLARRWRRRRPSPTFRPRLSFPSAALGVRERALERLRHLRECVERLPRPRDRDVEFARDGIPIASRAIGVLAHSSRVGGGDGRRGGVGGDGGDEFREGTIDVVGERGERVAARFERRGRGPRAGLERAREFGAFVRGAFGERGEFAFDVVDASGHVGGDGVRVGEDVVEVCATPRDVGAPRGRRTGRAGVVRGEGGEERVEGGGGGAGWRGGGTAGAGPGLEPGPGPGRSGADVGRRRRGGRRRGRRGGAGRGW